MIWDIETLLSALAGITPVQRLCVYLAEETITVVVILAVMLFIALLLVIALVLFAEGVRFGFHWLRANVVQIVGRSRSQLAHREAVANPPPPG
ncbi:MAG TPA: hypothetical protein VJP02_16250 [Candidatus Sulfotelmatobacter sp.]|nr:hypothetical protein [Candidatus Sulfotelmatobacter sp.]